MKDPKLRYYSSFTDDFAKVKNIPNKKKLYPKENRTQKFFSSIFYYILYFFGGLYCRLFLHVKYVGREKLKGQKGVFIYGNHTQSVGDVFIPPHIVFGARMGIVISRQNLGIPILGKALPYLGGLPVPESLDDMRQFNLQMEDHLKKGRNIVIYPEAHVWDYYTEIRPYPSTSFYYPVKYDKPVYCLTTTYQKRRLSKKPNITVYLDGPFYPLKELGKKSGAEELRNRIFRQMKERSKLSNCNYIKYININDKNNISM